MARAAECSSGTAWELLFCQVRAWISQTSFIDIKSSPPVTFLAVCGAKWDQSGCEAHNSFAMLRVCGAGWLLLEYYLLVHRVG
jgi:hypothetical protein